MMMLETGQAEGDRGSLLTFRNARQLLAEDTGYGDCSGQCTIHQQGPGSGNARRGPEALTPNRVKALSRRDSERDGGGEEEESKREESKREES